MSRPKKLRAIGEVASVFGWSVLWVRSHETAGDFRYPNGKLIEPYRTLNENGRLTSRKYDLQMIQDMADSMLRRYKINKWQHERVIRVIEAFRMVENQ
jgi:hypothetical protein